MVQAISDLPVVLTCFAFRQEYFSELDAMLVTLKEHHPDWPIVVGRGPLANSDETVLEVETPVGRCRWTLPIPLRLDDSDNDWRKITRMKGWWLSQVWHHCGGLADPRSHRVLWLDADARLNGPLDFAIEAEAELLSGVWWHDSENPAEDTMTGGLLLFQGAPDGPIAELLDRWSYKCLQQIQNLPPSITPWLDSDQEVLTEAWREYHEQGPKIEILELDYDKFCGMTSPDGSRKPGALVDQWQMSRKMKRREDRDRVWPPPEELRR